MLSNHFHKFHSCGNSALVFFDPNPETYPYNREHISSLLSNEKGVGADNLLIVKPSRLFDFEIVGFNRDGSNVGMCLNGVRCVTAFLRNEGRIAPSQKEVRFVLEGKEVLASFAPGDQDSIAVGISEYSFEPTMVPHTLNPVARGTQQADRGELPFYELQVPSGSFHVASVTLGNPHCVIFSADLSLIDLHRLGPEIENCIHFPERTNVEFVQIVDNERVRVLFWERGVGATSSSGSGALSAFLVANRAGYVGSRVTLELPGGFFEAGLGRFGQPTITGPVCEIFKGSLCVQRSEPLHRLRSSTRSTSFGTNAC
ncbi:MAG: diaminopimelate epimerase [Bdellovibrionales bacterium]|nr:diaminopimelate epimerase [Bdellovibrionales bacterium]